MDVRRVIAAVATAAAICALAWLHGFDFNERGTEALVVAYLSVWFGGLAAAYPFKDRK